MSMDLLHIICDLNAQSLIPQSCVDVTLQLNITDYNKAMRAVNHIQSNIQTSPNPYQYLMKVCDVLYRKDNETLQRIVADIRDQLRQQVKTGMCHHLIV